MSERPIVPITDIKAAADHINDEARMEVDYLAYIAVESELWKRIEATYSRVAAAARTIITEHDAGDETDNRP